MATRATYLGFPAGFFQSLNDVVHVVDVLLRRRCRRSMVLELILGVDRFGDLQPLIVQEPIPFVHALLVELAGTI